MNIGLVRPTNQEHKNFNLSAIIDSPERVTNNFAEIWTVADGNNILLKFLLRPALFALFTSANL